MFMTDKPPPTLQVIQFLSHSLFFLWDNLTLDYSSWRKVLHNGNKEFEQKRIEHEKLKRSICKGLDVHLKYVGTEFDLICNKCGHTYLSRVDIKETFKEAAYREKLFTTCYTVFLFAMIVENNVPQLVD